MYSYSQALCIGIRPKTLVASISPVMIGSAYALKAGPFNLGLCLSIFLCAICLQIFTNLINDYSDYKKGIDTEKRIGPARVMQMGIMTKSIMQKTILAFALLAAFFAVPIVLFHGTVILYLLILGLCLGYFYSSTKAAYCNSALADCIVFFFFGPFAVYFTQYLQTCHSQFPLIMGIGTGAFSASLLTLNNLRDYHQDTVSNKKTLVVRLGRTFGKGQIFLYYLLTIYSLYILSHSLVLPLSCLLLTLTSLVQFLKINTGKEYAAYFPKFAMFFWLYTFTICAFVLFFIGPVI